MCALLSLYERGTEGMAVLFKLLKKTAANVHRFLLIFSHSPQTCGPNNIFVNRDYLCDN